VPKRVEPLLREIASRFVTPSWSRLESRWECATGDFFFVSLGEDEDYLEANFYSRSGGMLTILFEEVPSWSADRYFETVAEILRVTGAIRKNRIVFIEDEGAGESVEGSL
jgi:hypothetical protein